jgi:Asp-tRNA(Asn)/Glu-tRNA(Gln) amidotransferase A subunit family amidase
MDAMGLAELVRCGEVEPAELLDAARARADEVNPRINAIVVDVEPAASV